MLLCVNYVLSGCSVVIILVLGLVSYVGLGAVVSKSFTKEPMARSGRRQDRGITRFLISGVSLGSAFVSDLDILGVAAVCRRLRRASD